MATTCSKEMSSASLADVLPIDPEIHLSYHLPKWQSRLRVEQPQIMHAQHRRLGWLPISLLDFDCCYRNNSLYVHLAECQLTAGQQGQQHSNQFAGRPDLQRPHGACM